MNSARYESPVNRAIEPLDNIKYLAEEMAQRKAQLNEATEEIKEDNVFHKIMFSQAVKHKSQIFINRNKKKMLYYFSLNKGSNDEIDKFKKNIDKKGEKGKRRRSISQMKNKDFRKSENKVIKTFAHHLSLKSQKDQIEDFDDYKNSEEKYFDDGSISGFESINDEYEENFNENDEEQEENSEKNENENDEEEEVDENEKNINEKENENGEIEKTNNDNDIEIKYANPKEVKIIYARENSPLYTKPNNKEIILKNKIKERNRYFYDKELKNNKIEKKRQILAKKNEDLFEISPFLNKNSMKIIDKNPEYRPINYRPIEVYHYKLAQIELNQNRNNLKKKNEEEKEIEIINYYKLNKRIFSQSSWDEFVEQEYYWQDEKRKATELLRYQMRKNITHRPNINKNSENIVKKKNINKRNYINNKDYIFTKLYNDQEKFDNKRKMKRQESMPSFKPLTNKQKNKDKNKKVYKRLNNTN